jgi:apoptosis-inducing factor 3
MESNIPGVFAAGDVAAAPLSLNGATLPDLVSIGHWQLAHYHGRVAGRNMAALLTGNTALKQKVTAVPFFWTVLFGKSIRYAGYGAGFDDVHITGDLANLQFVAYYLKQGLVVAVATLNSDPVAAQFAEYLAANKRPLTKEDLTSDHTAWQKK